MASIYDIDQNKLIENVAVELKKMPELKPPAWAPFVKTGTFKERPPVKPDWWYFRAASILRKLYKMGPIGTSKLRTLYGGKKDRGMRPEIFRKGSGSIIRKALQQLEKAGLAAQVEKPEKGRHKGRIITPKGKSLLDKTATQIQHATPKPVTPKPVKKPVKVKKVAKKEAKVEEKPEAKEIIVEKEKTAEKEPKKPKKEEVVVEKEQKETKTVEKEKSTEEKKPKEEVIAEKEEKALKEELKEIKELTEEVMKKEITK